MQTSLQLEKNKRKKEQILDRLDEEREGKNREMQQKSELVNGNTLYQERTSR